MSSNTAAPLWDFALMLYAEPGVCDFCLDMQDSEGMDVNLLLFAAWLAGRGVALTDERLEQAIALGRSWRERVIAPLRQARRWIKTEAADNTDWQRCREAIKVAELEAEKVALGQLQNLGEYWLGVSDASAFANVDYYLQTLGVSAKKREAGVNLVGKALCRLLERHLE